MLTLGWCFISISIKFEYIHLFTQYQECKVSKSDTFGKTKSGTSYAWFLTLFYFPPHIILISKKKWDKYSNFSIVIQLFVFKFCELGELSDDPPNCHFTLLQEKFINTWEPQCLQQLLCQPEAYFLLFWNQHLNTFSLMPCFNELIKDFIN